MPTTDDDRAHEVLGHDECLRLLGTASIGRVAYTQSALPAIRPVSFSVRGGDVLVLTPRESPLARALRGAVVAFEADEYDPELRTGWGVTVIGPSRVVEARSTGDPDLDGCVIAVRVGLVEGWRTTLPTRPTPG